MEDASDSQVHADDIFTVCVYGPNHRKDWYIEPHAVRQLVSSPVWKFIVPMSDRHLNFRQDSSTGHVCIIETGEPYCDGLRLICGQPISCSKNKLNHLIFRI